ncbi:hypothetical protein BIWAKO_05798 [Bosea sp. BIWAKO-01]|nr:hypothetical protein BIWAKO_05798 [Bosea sp. BIWAKO-01]
MATVATGYRRVDRPTRGGEKRDSTSASAPASVSPKRTVSTGAAIDAAGASGRVGPTTTAAAATRPGEIDAATAAALTD